MRRRIAGTDGASTEVERTQPARRRLARALARERGAILDTWTAAQLDPERLERFEVAGAEPLDRGWARDHFVAPLLDLLLRWIRDGDAACRDVYLDERLRYAPHERPAAERAQFFDELLPLDEAALLRAAGGAADRDSLKDLLGSLHADLRRPGSGSPIRMLALGDCLMNELRVFLPGACRRAGVEVDVRCLYFSGLLGRELDPERVRDVLGKDPPQLIAASFFSYAALPHYPALLRDADRLGDSELEKRVAELIGAIEQNLHALRARSDAPILLHNASGLPLARLRRWTPFAPPLSAATRRALDALNRALARLLPGVPGCVPIDEQALALRWGHRALARHAVRGRLGRRSMFHTSAFGQRLVEPYLEVIRSFARLRKLKVLAVDFDHTLWDGVMAEGPVRQHTAVQRLLWQLKEAGILLVSVSKNDPRNLRWDELALAERDFVLHKIGWQPKVRSLREAARELDLGLDCFALIDDSPQERGLVETDLPMVTCLDSRDPATWRALELLLAFPNTSSTAEGHQRTELYRQRVERSRALTEPVDYPRLMRGLGLRARFRRARRRDRDRIAELVQRTNQFNTTAIRYSRAQLAELLRSERHRVWVGELRDRFGDQGLVAAVVVERRDADAVLESFVMSCRAMGFAFEKLMLALTLRSDPAAPRWIGRFVPTDRNTPAAGLYADAGFQRSGAGEWLWSAGDPVPEIPPWFEIAPDRAGRGRTWRARKHTCDSRS